MTNLAVIGYGYWGPNLARNWSQIKRVNLKYICDVKEDRLALAKINYPQVNITNDCLEILKDKSIDAVNIATPIFSHYEIVKNALLHDKNVLVEKPLTTSYKEMNELAELAEKKKKILMVGHTFLYSPPVIKIKDCIEKGNIGTIEFIQLTRINLGKVKHDFNVIWDLAPHDFSILEYWLNKNPVWIQVIGKSVVYKNVCDVAFINMQYPDGELVNIHLSWLSPVKLRQSYIVGKKRMIVYDDTHPSEKVKQFDMGIDLIKDPETFGEFQLTYRTGDIHIPRLDNIEPLNAECNHFIDCIESDVIPKTGTEHAARIIKMIEAAQESLKNNGDRIYLS
ncbi:MAG: Gfo/Idh/MocA family oxidoreductase [Bacteroidales bacterium]|nr:Gfo/Idh/MocA family oxidoreductase [Bacteroidales bacterium]